MSTSKRVVKNTLFLYMRTIVSLLVSVFTTRVLLEALGASDYGLYNVVGGAIAMLGFLSASMSSVTQRFLSYAEGVQDEAKIIQYFNNSIIIHNGLAVIMVVVFGLSSLIFFNGILNIPDGKIQAAIIIYICMLVSTVFSITVVPYEAEINAHENMLFYSILGIIDVLLKFSIAIVVLYLKSEKLIFYAVLMAIESFVLRYVTQIYCKHQYKECRKISLRANYDKNVIKEMLSFAGWNLTNIGTGMISLFGMNVVANHYFGTQVNAAMGVATQLTGVMMGLSTNMLKAIAPVIVKSEGSKQHDKMLEISYISCRYSYLLFSFACIPVLLYLPKVLSTWLIVVPQWTRAFCVLLIVSSLIEQLTVVLYQSIIAGGKIKYYNIVRSITNILPIIVSVLVFQYTDAAPYWVIIFWLIFKALGGDIVNLYYACKDLQLKISKYAETVILPCFVSTMIVLFVGWVIHYACNYCQANELIGLGLTYLSSVFVWGTIAINQKERILIKSFIMKIVKK